MAQISNAEWNKQWAKMVAKAWADEGYKARLVADPSAVLAEEGIPVPKDVTIIVHEMTPKVAHLVLPTIPPDMGDMSNMEERLAAESCCCCPCCCTSSCGSCCP